MDIAVKVKTFPKILSATLAALLAASVVLAANAVVAFAPQYAGQFGSGGGANTTFLQINSDWHDSTVLWNDATQQYGSGAPIGTYPWSTGLWGLSDWNAVQQTAAGLGGPTAPTIINQ